MYIKVRVKTGVRAEQVVKESDDHFVVSVKERAQRNMANKRILQIFKRFYPNRSIRFVKGQHTGSKIIEVG